MYFNVLLVLFLFLKQIFFVCLNVLKHQRKQQQQKISLIITTIMIIIIMDKKWKTEIEIFLL